MTEPLPYSPEFENCWQSYSHYDADRRTMVMKIAKILKRTKFHDKPINDYNRSKLITIAKKFELSLYRSASSIDEYNDDATLNNKVSNMYTRFKELRHQRQKKETTKTLTQKKKKAMRPQPQQPHQQRRRQQQQQQQHSKTSSRRQQHQKQIETESVAESVSPSSSTTTSTSTSTCTSTTSTTSTSLSSYSYDASPAVSDAVAAGAEYLARGDQCLRDNKFDEARGCYDKSLLLFYSNLGQDAIHGYLAKVLYALGVVHHQQENYEQARTFCEKSLNMYYRLYGQKSNNKYIIDVLRLLQNIEKKLGNHDMAGSYKAKSMAQKYLLYQWISQTSNEHTNEEVVPPTGDFERMEI